MNLFLKRNLTKSNSFVFISLYILIYHINVLAITSALPDTNNHINSLNSNTFKFEFGIAAGGGFNKIDLGKNPNNNKLLQISYSGGVGIKLNVGFCFAPAYELNLTYIYQTSPLIGQNTTSLSVENVEGDFSRSIYLFTPKYNLSISKDFLLKFGIGLGMYGPGEFSYEIKSNTFLVLIPVWQTTKEYICKYRSSPGFHGSTEIEYFFTAWLSGTIGMKYYYVNYSLKSIKYEGNSIPITEEIKKVFDDVNGSGFDFMFSIVFYLGIINNIFFNNYKNDI